MKRSLLTLFLTFIVLAACSAEQEETLTDYPNAGLLVHSQTLDTLLQEPGLLLIDAREETGDSLIPGAVHVPAISSLTDPEHPVSSFLVGPERFGELMRRAGLNPGDRVVIYDEGNGLAAARLFYALEYHGFSNASILNGGFRGWVADGMPVTDRAADPGSGTFEAVVQEARMCSFEDILAAIEDPDKIIFDTRSTDEYTGTDVRAERGGHIPDAVHLEWSMVLQPEGVPYFLSATEIQQKYDSLGITRDKEVIPHCQSNVRGSHAYFTLRLMGYDSVRPYEGSWAEYGNREDAVIRFPGQ